MLTGPDPATHPANLANTWSSCRKAVKPPDSLRPSMGDEGGAHTPHSLLGSWCFELHPRSRLFYQVGEEEAPKRRSFPPDQSPRGLLRPRYTSVSQVAWLPPRVRPLHQRWNRPHTRQSPRHYSYKVHRAGNGVAGSIRNLADAASRRCPTSRCRGPTHPWVRPTLETGFQNWK